MQDKQIYIKRRNKLMSMLNKGLVIIPNADELIRNRDSVYPYRFDSDFFYLTGFNEPESVLVLDTNNKKSMLFCREKNPEREIWDGFRYGIKVAKAEFGFDETYPINDFTQKITELLSGVNKLYYTIGLKSNYDGIIINTINSLWNKARGGVVAPQSLIDINSYIAECRLFKDEYDIEYITKSCQISTEAHITAMKYVRHAKYEYEIEAKILEIFYRNGSRYPAYPAIVASGGNACILHYIANNAKLNPHELLLVDAGSEYNGYAADITRTYPIGGKFTREQQAVYEIVLAANKAAIAKIQVGNLWNEPSDIAVEILTQGLIDLKLLRGSLQDNIAQGKYKKFYMHSIGHWLGLDVHDVGTYKVDDKYRSFVAGMCTTIEPGLYIAPDSGVPEKFWNIGIRIEDDILLTDTGHKNLTDGVPKEVKDIEYLVNA